MIIIFSSICLELIQLGIWVLRQPIKLLFFLPHDLYTNLIYLYGFGFGISFDWSSQTGAGSRNGGCGGGVVVVVGGRIGPVFVLKSTRIENAVDTNIDTKTITTHIICKIFEKKKITTNVNGFFYMYWWKCSNYIPIEAVKLKIISIILEITLNQEFFYWIWPVWV